MSKDVKKEKTATVDAAGKSGLSDDQLEDVSGGKQQDYLIITMENVMVSSGVSSSDDAEPRERFTSGDEGAASREV